MALDNRLMEMSFGPYEGGDLTNLPPELLGFFRDPSENPAPPGVEQLPDLVARLGSFLEDMKAEILAGGAQAELAAGRGLDENVLIATHAIALKAALEYLDPAAEGKWFNTFVKNCAVFCFDIVDGEFTTPAEVVLD